MAKGNFQLQTPFYVTFCTVGIQDLLPEPGAGGGAGSVGGSTWCAGGQGEGKKRGKEMGKEMEGEGDGDGKDPSAILY